MDMVDGNAIAGALFEFFGEEMTTAVGTCGSCGSASRVGEFHVYVRAPGAVARCPSCGHVLMVLVERGGVTDVDTRGLTSLDSEA